jgi:hypothetical protein
VVVTRNSCNESGVNRSTLKKSSTALLLVHVHAVERDVRLIGTRAVDVAAALHIIFVAGGRRHARLQRKQARNVARIQLSVVSPPVVEQ